MTSRIHLAVGVLLLSMLAIRSEAAAAESGPDKDPRLVKVLQEARTHIDRKELPDAIEKCDTVIAAFKKHYEHSNEQIYCARTSPESLGYLLKAAGEADKGKSKQAKAIVLSSTWSDAYFKKAYALQDLGRFAEAKSAILRAVELSPWNCLYLCELGSVYKFEKDWAKAKEAYQTAEDQASLGPDNSKAAELAQARRGLGYVLVELGQLDEAEKKYLQCLATDPDDKKAARELEYVREQKAKRKLL
jgi:tetratricopeptide (TPR) repeat protein